MRNHTSSAQVQTAWWDRPGVLEIITLLGPLALVGLILAIG
jgi:hypothetical protein